MRTFCARPGSESYCSSKDLPAITVSLRTESTITPHQAAASSGRGSPLHSIAPIELANTIGGMEAFAPAACPATVGPAAAIRNREKSRPHRTFGSNAESLDAIIKCWSLLAIMWLFKTPGTSQTTHMQRRAPVRYQHMEGIHVADL